MLVAVARRLDPLLDDLVFVGGQVAELLITDPAAVRIRGTDDVDVIVKATTRTQYETFSEKLRALGLRLDTSEGAPVCRWLTPDGIKVDVMPLEERVFGLSTQWFPYAFESASKIHLAEDLGIRVPAASAFLATKWAAYEDRGEQDPFGSHDLEDIVTVVAGRDSIVGDVLAARPDVRAYIGQEARAFLESESAGDVVAGALPDSRFDPAIVDRALDRLRGIAVV